MEEAAELANYLPLSFKTPKEQEYIEFLWDAYEGWGRLRRRTQPLTPTLSPPPRKGEGVSGRRDSPAIPPNPIGNWYASWSFWRAGRWADRFRMESTDRQLVECGLKGQKVVGSGFPTLRKTQTGVGWPPLKAREPQTASRSASLKAREAKRSSVRRPRRLNGAKLPAVCLPRSLNGGKRTPVSYF